MAWLHSAPQRDKKDEEPETRLNSLPEEHPARNLPYVNNYMASCFQLSGFCLVGFSGAIPLTWNEINSFAERSDYPLTGWESEQIIQMSRDYCYMLSKGKEIDCPAPYSLAAKDEDAKEVNRSIVNDRFLSMLNAME